MRKSQFGFVLAVERAASIPPPMQQRLLITHHICAMLNSMQKWEYRVFASHLDPAELVVLLDESGSEGWELVTLVAVIDHLPLEVIEPAAAAQALKSDEGSEVIPLQAFRYIFKRLLVTP